MSAVHSAASFSATLPLLTEANQLAPSLSILCFLSRLPTLAALSS